MDYFFYNTDADEIKDVPTKPRFRVLIEKGFAAAGGQRKYGEKFRQLKGGDILLMYENRRGVIAIGRVSAPWDGTSHHEPWYYNRDEIGDPTGGNYEYRIPIEWFLDLSQAPVTLDRLRKQFHSPGYAPRGAVQKIKKHRADTEALIADLTSREPMTPRATDHAPANRSGGLDLAKPQPSAWNRLPDKEADQDPAYVPQDTDRREVVERQIRERRGQQQFRDALCQRYARRCLITESDVLAVLEAAHINPYRGEDDNHVTNGLLLRSDIHTLFDLNLIGIEPDELRVELHPTIRNDAEYGTLAGKVLCCGQAHRPAHEALKKRYEQFQQLSR